jgi:hypothetical protein
MSTSGGSPTGAVALALADCGAVCAPYCTLPAIAVRHTFIGTLTTPAGGMGLAKLSGFYRQKTNIMAVVETFSL